MTTKTATLAQQCTAPDGTRASWIFEGDSYRTGVPLSKYFKDTAELFTWLHANGWTPVPGTYAGKWWQPRGAIR